MIPCPQKLDTMKKPDIKRNKDIFLEKNCIIMYNRAAWNQ
jgi:hypothetical protein